MRKLILLFFCGSAVAASGQGNSYTAFIQLDTNIHWAGISDKLIDLSPKVKDYSLKKWYLGQVSNSGATAYREENGQLTPYLLRKEIDVQDWVKGLVISRPQYKNPKEWYFRDKKYPLSDINGLVFHTGTGFSGDSCCGCDDADAFRARQLLTYRNSRFEIYNVFISPLCVRRDDNNKYNWYPLFNVAFNGNPQLKFPGMDRNVVLINTDEVDYDFSGNEVNSADSVLTVYRAAIGDLVYNDITRGKLKAVDPESGVIIAAKKFLTWRMPSDTVQVYDIIDPDKIKGYQVVQRERNPRELSRFRIRQELYFDFKNERLFSVIKSVTVMMPVENYSGIRMGYIAFCRLVY
jgi:hypothetical protein